MVETVDAQCELPQALRRFESGVRVAASIPIRRS